MPIFSGLYDPVPIPAHIAVCPECGGNLEAEFIAFDALVEGVNLYEPSDPMLYCRNETSLKHDMIYAAGWSEAYHNVYEWLKSECILIEVEPGEILCPGCTDLN